MDGIFNQLKEKGQNTVENLIKWMRDAKLIDTAKADAEQTIRALFNNIPDPRDVSLSKFKEIVTQFATEQKKPLEEFTNKLLGEGPAFLKLADDKEGGHSAFEDEGPSCQLPLGPCDPSHKIAQ